FLTVLFVVLFTIAISAVFFGFIGYYSRVSLSNELRQNKDGASVDLLFMTVDQIAIDEQSLLTLRTNMDAIQFGLTPKLNALRETANSSKEFSTYFEAKSKLVSYFNGNHNHLTDDYWKSLTPSLYSSVPDGFEQEIAIWTVPAFRPTVTEVEK